MVAVLTLAAIAIVAIVTELVRRTGRWGGFVAFVVLPLVVVPVLLANGSTTFGLVKLFSVLVASWFVMGLRHTTLVRWPPARFLAVVLLWLNIVEAGVAGLVGGSWAVALGAACLLASQAGPRHVDVERVGRHRDVVYALTWPWITVYTIWNLTFVYGAAVDGRPGTYILFAVVHLAVPLVLSFGRSKRWVQARTFSLALLMMWPFATPSWLDASGLYRPELHQALEVLTVTSGLFLVARRLRWGAAAVGWRDHPVGDFNQST